MLTKMTMNTVLPAAIAFPKIARAYSGVPTAKIVSAEEALSVVKSDSRIFFHSAAATPAHLAQATASLVGKVKNVEVCSIHTEGTPFYLTPAAQGTFRANCFFLGAAQRTAVKNGLADYVPIFLSDIPRLLREELPIDVAFISVSPPDKHGFCSMGPSVDVSLAAVRTAKVVVAQVNRNIPRIHGDGIIHASQITYMVEKDEPLPILKPAKITPEMTAIGSNIASLVEDGSTLQMGIGAIPDATLSLLHDRKDLGIHTEMFSEGLIDLVEKGVVTNQKKAVMPGHIVGSFFVGTQKLYDYVNDNPLVRLHPSEFVNDPAVIKLNPKVVAINSAIEVDITGQICADSIGETIFSGFGGQVDFERGAALSKGGRPIIALPSRTNSGEPRIVSTLKPGAGVVTSRAHAHWIITEHGKADLWGKNLAQRAVALINISHPDDRKDLYDAAAKRFGASLLKYSQ